MDQRTLRNNQQTDWILDQKNDISEKTGEIQVKSIVNQQNCTTLISALEQYTTVMKDVNIKGILFLYLFFKSKIILK